MTPEQTVKAQRKTIASLLEDNEKLQDEVDTLRSSGREKDLATLRRKLTLVQTAWAELRRYATREPSVASWKKVLDMMEQLETAANAVGGNRSFAEAEAAKAQDPSWYRTGPVSSYLLEELARSIDLFPQDQPFSPAMRQDMLRTLTELRELRKAKPAVPASTPIS